jgi:SAM-dependent methyltransferase
VTSSDTLEFYRDHAQDYSRVSHDFLGQQYTDPSHPEISNDRQLLARLKTLIPGKKGLDAGCGAGARDVFLLWQEGYDMTGVDAVPENIREAARRHPEIADRVSVADLREPLPFPDASFDFVVCNAVIQHISPDVIKNLTLPELARVLRPTGVLQIMFKNGQGVETVLDPDYDIQRTFQLYDEHEVAAILEDQGCRVLEPESEGMPGGFMYLTDMKPMRHCVFHSRKR